MALKVIKTEKELKEQLKDFTPSQIGFVPTMGALHEGHLSLIRRAKDENEVVVVSLFVNPTQFNDPRDLMSYPRTPEADIEALEREKVDIAFMPGIGEIYPEPDNRVFDFGLADKVMEGATRPGHFNGVAQVVSKLFKMINPGKSYFGEKDFQQIAIIRLMTERLGFNVEIVSCPTMREHDGLAMSSRNQLLDEKYRKAAAEIYRTMSEAAEFIRDALTNEERHEDIPTPRVIEKMVTDKVNSNHLLKVIYFNLVNGRTLADADSWNEPDGVVGCIAVEVGRVRLIDNIRFV